ncbi:MAG TPA: DUF47 domain-containing protein [Lachnospiraceae bacterium]|jgi:uncharacterized protein Yka (UPF0111/DUF47 family)|uniref:DUF47 domain-containing protein n=1 Tax=Clostridium sp. (strain SY8519) TaxID=1042156 RepID=UPI0002172196|nr:DUF47 family protein [Clostridium sp. SY8519]BAK47995.1 phosphate transport regulator [Clostridium sp. SY8519]HAD20472.1 DUF47 domain-containing protein [Lachnospiraceae bacterium]
MSKKQDKLFVQLLRIAENMKQTAAEFQSYQILENGKNMTEFSDRIKELESVGDTLVHETIVELNKSFITPIEHEDILQLAERMDEVVDGIEESTIYMDMFGLYQKDEYIEAFKENLKLCTEELQTAVELLAAKKLADIHAHTVNVKSYEETCDHVERTAIRELFEKYKEDPLTIMKRKDIYQLLENTVDNCQLVAKLLDMVVMKNM